GQSIFQRDEETAHRITASFVVDLQELREFGLKPEEAKLLLGLCLWKINAFLRRGTRLRSGCDLTFVPPAAARLDWEYADAAALLSLAQDIKGLIRAAFPDDRADRAFVVLRDESELISKAGQAADAEEEETSEEQPEPEGENP